jgi:hypothetical protein
MVETEVLVHPVFMPAAAHQAERASQRINAAMRRKEGTGVLF